MHNIKFIIDKISQLKNHIVCDELKDYKLILSLSINVTNKRKDYSL